MDASDARSLEQVRAFLAGSASVPFAGQGRGEVYAWAEGKAEKGLVRRCIAQMTGLSRAQLTRLITCYRTTGQVKASVYQCTKFAVRYTCAAESAENFGAISSQEPSRMSVRFPLGELCLTNRASDRRRYAVTDWQQCTG